VKPDLIMLSTCLMGQTGPLANYGGFGNLAAAISGFGNLCGWPDRPPAGPYGAYTDYIAPRFNAVMVLAALDYRRRTGEGQFLDVSQAESSLHFLGSALLDYTANGRVQESHGNQDPGMAPHGVYPVAGEDRWIAISVRDDAEFAALCDLLGRSDLARDERFATLEQRLAHQADLDALLAAWTRDRDAHETEAALQSRGIAASVAQMSADLCGDPQLAHRGHFVSVDHPTYGPTPVESSRFILSRTPARISGRAPTFGGDNEQVLKEILGYDDERITELVIAGALE
jgi:crotonobetainyl-CoA:carnitine CoA-transferase CaiB-like acyl-CoA transferase